jgi:predicted O-methyltransferase YrrM
MRRFVILLLFCSAFSASATPDTDRSLKRLVSELVPLSVEYEARAIHGLIDTLFSKKPNIVVETRSAQGCGLYALARGLHMSHAGVVYGIDTWDEYAIDRMELKRLLKKTGARAHCALLRCDPIKGAGKFREGTIDLFHAYGEKGVDDLAHFLPKIRSGGSIIIDELDLPPTIAGCSHLKTDGRQHHFIKK